MSLARPCHW